MNNKNNEIVDQDITLDVTCPLCQAEEYLISGDGEKFTCADCGFHTKHFSSITRLYQTPQLPPESGIIHPISYIQH